MNLEAPWIIKLVTIMTEPTRQGNVVDLILTSNPTCVSKPDLSDHAIVLTEVAIKPTQAKQKRRKTHLNNSRLDHLTVTSYTWYLVKL